MAKLKFKEDGLERLVLKGAEIRLVAALVENVRLGMDGDPIKEAAASILNALNDSELNNGMQFIHDVNLGLTVEDSYGCATELSFDAPQYNLCLEATDSTEDGCDTCVGCGCEGDW